MQHIKYEILNNLDMRLVRVFIEEEHRLTSIDGFRGLESLATYYELFLEKLEKWGLLTFSMKNARLFCAEFDDFTGEHSTIWHVSELPEKPDIYIHRVDKNGLIPSNAHIKDIRFKRVDGPAEVKMTYDTVVYIRDKRNHKQKGALIISDTLCSTKIDVGKDDYAEVFLYDRQDSRRPY